MLISNVPIKRRRSAFLFHNLTQPRSRKSNAVENSAIPNVVGYQTVDVVAGKWYLVAAQFGPCTGATEIPFQDFIKVSEEIEPIDANMGEDDTAAQIQTWDPTDGYLTYWWLARARNTDLGIGWTPNQWAVNRGALDPDLTVKVGASVWFRSHVNGKITVAGQVVSGESTTVDIVPNKWNLIANPFPTKLYLNGSTTGVTNIDWTAVANFTEPIDANMGEDDTAAQIQTWDPDDGYLTYWWLYRARNTDLGITWTYSQWAVNRGALQPDLAIEPGHGFWLRYPGDNATTLSFKR